MTKPHKDDVKNNFTPLLSGKNHRGKKFVTDLNIDNPKSAATHIKYITDRKIIDNDPNMQFGLLAYSQIITKNYVRKDLIETQTGIGGNIEVSAGINASSIKKQGELGTARVDIDISNFRLNAALNFNPNSKDKVIVSAGAGISATLVAAKAQLASRAFCLGADKYCANIVSELEGSIGIGAHMTAGFEKSTTIAEKTYNFHTGAGVAVGPGIYVRNRIALTIKQTNSKQKSKL